MKNKGMKGFTLIETLLGLVLVMASTYLFSIIIVQTNELFRPTVAQNYYEWQTFLLQLERELKNKKECQIVDNCLIAKEAATNESNETVCYEWYRKKVRKRRNGMGHHVLLMNVESWTVKKQASVIRLQVVFSDGHQYTGSVLIDEQE